MNARQRYTELVRHFLSGRMTNFEYEIACDALMRDLDEASDKVYCELWYSYCDVREHRMGRERGMTREGRRTVARWIMFLKSNRPFEYRHMIYPNSLVAFLTFGLVRKYEYPENTGGDQDYWPYYRKSDFDYDLAYPLYLSGAQAHGR